MAPSAESGDGVPATIHVADRRGYVWDADAAHRLRRVHGLVGAMVGGVSVFKQQNSVHGLPLELEAEEVTLAVEKGWGLLQPAVATAEHVAYMQRHCRKRQRDHMGYAEEEEQLGGADDDWDPNAPLPPDPEWKQILKEGTRMVLPDTPADLARTLPAAAVAADEAGGPAAAAGPAPEWDFPATEEERHRYWVFRDLHNQGLRITGGSKFGADYLVYPGDPTLYHAQFCLRLVPYRQPLLAANLAAACRGSAMARKHLLLASVVEGEEAVGACVPRPADGSVRWAAAGSAAAAAEEARQEDKQQGQGQQGQQQVRQQQGQQQQHFQIHYVTLGPVDGFG